MRELSSCRGCVESLAKKSDITPERRRTQRTGRRYNNTEQLAGDIFVIVVEKSRRVEKHLLQKPQAVETKRDTTAIFIAHTLKKIKK